MKFETIKSIYIEVLVYEAKIQYHGKDDYTIIRYFSSGDKHLADYRDGITHGRYIWWDEYGNIINAERHYYGKFEGKFVNFNQFKNLNILKHRKNK